MENFILKKRKTAAIVSVLIFISLLIPVLSLSYVNRATGDDYGYGILTRAAWNNTHSLIEVGKAACKGVKQYYYSWQGTWFSIFMFSIQPEVFHDGAYIIVAFLMLFLWIGSTFYLLKQILCKKAGIDKWSFFFLTVWFLIISIEFIPSTKSAIYWYNGCAHYMLPFSMCQIAAAWLFRYSEEYKKRYLFGITVFMALLGGSNYQAALFALIAACYAIAAVFILKKDKRILTLLLPVFAETVGLVISMTAPGNMVRATYEENGTGGNVFGFSVMKAVKTIGNSFLYAVKDVGLYLQERPLSLVGLFFLFLSFVVIFCISKDVVKFKYPVWVSVLLFCLYSAMQAPAIYAEVPVSGGVPNTNFQVFLLTAAGILWIIAGQVSEIIKAKWKEETDKKVFRMIAVPGVLLCLLMAFLGRSNIKTSVSYVSLVYIANGEAADYKWQMDLQTRLMEDENTADVIVPFINDVQGPLMHMPVTADEKAFTNWVAAQFYGKNSIVAIERPVWEELYGDTDIP